MNPEQPDRFEWDEDDIEIEPPEDDEPEQFMAVGQPRDAEGQWTKGGGTVKSVKTKADAEVAVKKVFLIPKGTRNKLDPNTGGASTYSKVSSGNVELAKKPGGWSVTGDGVKGKANFYAKELTVRHNYNATAPTPNEIFLHG